MSAENIINNPPEVFREPCEACGVSEFRLGVRHAEERILDALHSKRRQLDQLLILAEQEGDARYIELVETRIVDVENFIELVKGEQK